MTEPLPLRRWVIDTNVLVSWVLRPRSAPGRAVDRAIDLGRLLFSKETHRELLSVIRRSKFDRYVPLDRRLAVLVKLDDLIDWIPSTRTIRSCRDPNDDKFLEVAVHGNADALISGDADLLVLHPFHGVPILGPQAFLAGTEPNPPGTERGSGGVLQEPRASYRTRIRKAAPAAAKA
ncbi:putative toxin-antitoxin system toxin component, PIN family [Variovorax paradoxus]|nr:putative toxin-antitoxin system toxin component, PIN family [Variovorax paradoxus]